MCGTRPYTSLFTAVKAVRCALSRSSWLLRAAAIAVLHRKEEEKKRGKEKKKRKKREREKRNKKPAFSIARSIKPRLFFSL